LELSLQPDDIVTGVFRFVILILSITVHECAHAWTASRLGDQTARMEGRVTLNPANHIDPLGTLLIPAVAIFGHLIGLGSIGRYLIGWGRPCPVNTRNFQKLVRDDSLVTLAGPASNLLLALMAFALLAALRLVAHGWRIPEDFLLYANGFALLCYLAMQINIMLFFFNLLPIPPLDGSHIVRHQLPYNWLNAYDSVGMFGIILMIVVGGPIVGFLMNPVMGLLYGALNAI
jgi:Zn-dependent protease